MSSNEQIDPAEATRLLHRELRQPEDAPVTAGEFGLAITAMVVGILVAVITIPAGVLFYVNDLGGVSVLAMLPFAIVASVCGFIGRRSAMGVAGMALGIVAALESVGVLAYIEIKVHNTQVAELQRERARENAANAEKDKRNQELLKTQADADLAYQTAVAATERRKTADAELEAQQIADAEKIAARNKKEYEERSAAARMIDENHQLAAKAEAEQRAAEAKRLEARKAEQNKADAQHELEDMQKDAERKEADRKAAAAAARQDLQTAIRARADAEEEYKKIETAIRVADNSITTNRDLIRKLDALDPRPSNYSQLAQKYRDDIGQAEQRRNRANGEEWQARQKLDAAKKAEQDLRNIIPAAPGVNPFDGAPVNAPKVIGIYKTEDAEIHAVTVVEVDNSYMIKDDKGKMHTLKKSDVREIVKP